MRRLFALTAILLALWAVLIGVVRLGAGMRPSRFAAMFTLPDGSACPVLCILGVMPGETPFEWIIPILRQHPLSAGTNIREQYGIIRADGPQFSFSALMDKDGRAGAVSLSFESTSGVVEPMDGASVGFMVAKLGSPQRLQLTRRSSQTVRLFYPSRGIVLSSNLSTTRLQSRDRLSFVGFSTLPVFVDTWRGIMLSTAGWQGYRDLRPLVMTAGYP